jgi:Putative peptidoglycan binding domain
MKITTISKVASLVISSVMIQTAVAGHAVGIGVGPRFGGGGFGGGILQMLFGNGGFHSAPAYSGGARSTFGAHPTFGQPVILRSPSRNWGVYHGHPSPEPTVTAVQQDLTKLGYYHGSIDGLYGRATRGAVARYQTGHHLAVTGTLTSQTLQLLGVSPTGRAEIGLEPGTNRTREIASCVE